MGKVSYIDNNSILGQCYIARTFDILRTEILNMDLSGVKYLKYGNEIFGYSISRNNALSEIYKFPCFVVKFIFSSVDTLHNTEQEEVMKTLCEMLYHDINETKGYYNLRIPAHIVDLQKAVNNQLHDLIHCGGTVEQIHVGDFVMPTLKEGLRLFWADEDFINNKKEVLMDMAFKSFESYQGQYHISHVTDKKAGEIYSNWIGSFFDDFLPNTILIAEYQNEIIGYCTISENDFAIDAILSSVNENKRGLGTYKAMIATLIQYAKQNNKMFVSSTQFDNYIVQGTWNALGLRPFASVYNLHYDNR